ncbi:hypothetical protein [Ferdinandcohnia sp. SAFN-114]|uniref:hypothetical protein n=1 Tax=Ferdinandcohnia sp. SAFN-114 TaxID=3387275 RepID=UPI003F7F6474
MKRYWKIITLSVITVLVIGAFYINSSLAAENIVVGIEKVSGNEKEIENIRINGDLSGNDIHHSLLISKDKTINLSNQSLIEELTRTSTVPAYNQLKEKYSHFMRGKSYLENSLYADENFVVYVNVEGNGNVSKNMYFEIEVLDVKTDKTTSMELDVPNDDNYHWVEVMEVQSINNEIKVIARGFRTESGEDLNVYTIDLDKKAVSDETIYGSPKIENGWSDIRVVDEYYSVEPKKYLLFQVYAHEEPAYEDAVEMGEPKIIEDEIMVYNIETNQLKKLEMSPEERGYGIDSFAINDTTIYIPNQSPNGIEVNQYNIEKDSWGEKQIFKVEQEKGEHAPFIELQNGKIYIISSVDGKYPFAISDLNTGQSLYEGTLVVKNQKKEQQDYKLYIYEINN